MSNILGYHSFEKIILLFNGVRLGTFTEDGGVTYERGSAETHGHMAGPGGVTTAFRISDKRLIATIDLLETSPSYALLWEFHRQQINAPRRPPLCRWTHANPISGEGFSVENGLIIGVPAPSAQREPGARSFQILFPYSADDIKPAPLNLAAKFPLPNPFNI
jgi:hypothetical protein